MHLIKTTAVLASSFGLISAAYDYPSADANELHAREAYDMDGPELYERDAFDYDDHALYARDAEAEAEAEADEYGFADDSRLFARSPSNLPPPNAIPGPLPNGHAECSVGCQKRYLNNKMRINHIALQQGMSKRLPGGSAASGKSSLSLQRRGPPLGAEMEAQRARSMRGARPTTPFDKGRMDQRNEQSKMRCQHRCNAGAPGVGGGRGGSQEQETRKMMGGGLPRHDGSMSMSGGASGSMSRQGSMGSGAQGAGGMGGMGSQNSKGGASGGDMARSNSQLSMSSMGSGSKSSMSGMGSGKGDSA